MAVTCDLCGEPTTLPCTGFVTRPYGINYMGAWLHPLTPRYVDTKGQYLPVHPQPGGISYRHFGQLTQSSDRGQPPTVVHAHLQSKPRRQGMQTRLWSFGYDMDNMKARGYVEAYMPTECIPADAELRKSFTVAVDRMLAGADEMGRALCARVVEAVDKDKTASHGTDKVLGATIAGALWRATEVDFYAHLGKVRTALEAGLGGQDVTVEAETSWFELLGETTRNLFETLTDLDALVQIDPRRASEAASRLRGAIWAITKKFGGGGTNTAAAPDKGKSKGKSKKPNGKEASV